MGSNTPYNKFLLNSNVFNEKGLGVSANSFFQELGKKKQVETFSGVDTKVTIIIPPLNKNQEGVIHTFEDLQTLSISSTRSVSPVRVLGTASPVAYTRGARTFAGTMVFVSRFNDTFFPIYKQHLAESTLQHSTSFVSDQLPPFNLLVTVSSEMGKAASRLIVGATLVNYGTTHSVDDMYTEATYSYVAQDVTMLASASISLARETIAKYETTYTKSLSDLNAEMKTAAGMAQTLQRLGYRVDWSTIASRKDIMQIMTPEMQNALQEYISTRSKNGYILKNGTVDDLLNDINSLPNFNTLQSRQGTNIDNV